MKKQREITFTLNPYLVQIFIVILGIAMIVISDYTYSSPWPWWKDWGNKVINSLGCTIVAAGGVSIMLELSTIKSYISQAFHNILFCKFPIEQYQKGELLELKNSIAQYIINTHHKEQDLDTTLYKFEKLLLELSCKDYYLYHKSNIVLEPDSKQQVIHKKATIEYCLINQTSPHCNAEFSWSILAPKGIATEADILNGFKINKLTVCGKTYEPNEYKKFLSINKLQPPTYSLYDYSIKVKLPNYDKDKYSVYNGSVVKTKI